MKRHEANRTMKDRQRGSASVMSALTGLLIMGAGAIAVDVGYVFWSQGRLQNAADAAALVATKRLPNETLVRSTAQQFANANYPDGGNVIHDNEVILGVWDTATQQFTPLGASDTDSPNAVRIKARRAHANGNPLELFFAKVLGRDTVELKACALGKAVADAVPGGLGCPGGAIVAMDQVVMPGGALVDSYVSSIGTYESQIPGEKGHVASGGDIDMNGVTEVRGDVRPGLGHTVNMAGGGVTITGSTEPLPASLLEPEVDTSEAEIMNNNASLPTSVYNPGTRRFRLNGQETIEIPPGVYYFSEFTQTGGDILINGETTIYVAGDVKLAGNGITVAGGNPQLLTVWVAGQHNVDVAGTASFYGRIMAPKSNVDIHGTPNYYGCTLGRKVVVRGDAGIHYDEDMGDMPPGHNVQSVSAQLVGQPGC